MSFLELLQSFSSFLSSSSSLSFASSSFLSNTSTPIILLLLGLSLVSVLDSLSLSSLLRGLFHFCSIFTASFLASVLLLGLSHASLCLLVSILLLGLSLMLVVDSLSLFSLFRSLFHFCLIFTSSPLTSVLLLGLFRASLYCLVSVLLLGLFLVSVLDSLSLSSLFYSHFCFYSILTTPFLVLVLLFGLSCVFFLILDLRVTLQLFF